MILDQHIRETSVSHEYQRQQAPFDSGDGANTDEYACHCHEKNEWFGDFGDQQAHEAADSNCQRSNYNGGPINLECGLLYHFDEDVWPA